MTYDGCDKAAIAIVGMRFYVLPCRENLLILLQMTFPR